MTTTQKPESLRLADKYEAHVFLGDHRFAQDHWCRQAAAELRSQHARIAELEKDAARLLYATKDYDGFMHVERDKYDFILECMEEAGRSEPTDEDELNGVRRLIDAAISAETKQGKAQS